MACAGPSWRSASRYHVLSVAGGFFPCESEMTLLTNITILPRDMSRRARFSAVCRLPPFAIYPVDWSVQRCMSSVSFCALRQLYDGIFFLVVTRFHPPSLSSIVYPPTSVDRTLVNLKAVHDFTSWLTIFSIDWCIGCCTTVP